MKLFEADLQLQVMLHQPFGIQHKRLQEKDLLVKRRTRGLRPTEKNRSKIHTRKRSGAPPETRRTKQENSFTDARGLPPWQEIELLT